ncbi:hypothetical protein V2J09_021600 [Rumex salicifolius]
MASIKSGISLPGSSLNCEPAEALSAVTLRFQTSLTPNESRRKGVLGGKRWRMLKPIAALEDTKTVSSGVNNGRHSSFPNGKSLRHISTIGKSSNILWHECSVNKSDREELLKQKGCVIWITGLSGSGKSTVASALSRILHSMGKMTYVLDGDNLRHGLNSNLTFKAEDRAENIRRTGEVAKLFADAGVICIASLISPYKRDRDACRALLPAGEFVEVFMDIPLEVCESRDPKGLYKLARAGKIKGFTGVDDPYEKPLNCEVVLEYKPGECTSPCEMAQIVASYLNDHGYLQS